MLVRDLSRKAISRFEVIFVIALLFCVAKLRSFFLFIIEGLFQLHIDRYKAGHSS